MQRTAYTSKATDTSTVAGFDQSDVRLPSLAPIGNFPTGVIETKSCRRTPYIIQPAPVIQHTTHTLRIFTSGLMPTAFTVKFASTHACTFTTLGVGGNMNIGGTPPVADTDSVPMEWPNFFLKLHAVRHAVRHVTPNVKQLATYTT
jgi:hypothetical protein